MRHDYITECDTPFLWKCAQQGEYYKRVVPSLGFCERTEILTGLNPKESGFFTAIGYDPKNSPFKGIKYLSLIKILEDLIPKKLRVPGKDVPGGFYRYYRNMVAKTIRKHSGGMNPYNIPFQLLPYWALTEDRIDHRQADAFQTLSILTLLTNAGCSYFYDSFTALNLPSNGTDLNRIKMALKTAGNNQYDLYLIYISLPDSIGHKYGPESSELKFALRRIDGDLQQYTTEFEKREPNSQFVFLGDHGMTPVTKYFDAEKVLLEIAKLLGLKLKRDFIYFLDSTLVRVWFLSDKAKKLLPTVFKSSAEFYDRGVFVDKDLAEKENIPWGDRRYGDLVWWANSGVLVFPDFFHRVEQYKGMHGYDPKLSASQGVCIVYDQSVHNKIIESIPLTGVFDILKRSLSL